MIGGPTGLAEGEHMRVMTVVGTRPEIIRLSRVIPALDRHVEHVLVHTGQNYDYELNQVFFEDLEIRKPDHFLEAAGKTAAETVGLVIARVDELLARLQPDALLLLGEVVAPHALTLRTSIIGTELLRAGSLIEWFLAQRGPIKGFRKAIYSGLTTVEMARAIEHLLLREPSIGGLWHLSSAPIDKFDLLTRLQARLKRTDVEIRPDDEFTCDRSLDSNALMNRIGYRVPSWDSMLDELAREIQARG